MNKFNLYLVASILAVSSSVASAQSMLDDYRSGFESGFRATQPYKVMPITPIVPVPQIGVSTYQQGLRDGVNQGQQTQTVPTFPSTNSNGFSPSWGQNE